MPETGASNLFSSSTLGSILIPWWLLKMFNLAPANFVGHHPWVEGKHWRVSSKDVTRSISLAAASQGKVLLFKAPNVCLLLSTDANFYRYHLRASEGLGAWLWITIVPWQQAAKLHIHFPVFRAETSVYSHKGLVDVSSCEPVGLIYLNTRLL